jgi:hypothetical protein
MKRPLAFTNTPIRICFHLDAENGLCAYLYTESDHGWLSKSQFELFQLVLLKLSAEQKSVKLLWVAYLNFFIVASIAGEKTISIYSADRFFYPFKLCTYYLNPSQLNF